MAVNCDPNSLVQASSCLDCIPEGRQLSVANYLLATLAGASIDPNALVKLSACLDCVPEGAQMSVVIALLCQLINSPSGGASLPTTPQTANQFFAGPTSGAAALPAFRALVSGDLPVNLAPKIGVPFGEIGPFISVAGSTVAANTVVAILFSVRQPNVSIGNVYWSLNTGVNGALAGFSIYAVTPGSTTRGVRLADTGPVAVSIANQGSIISPFIGGPVVLAEGVYCLAFSDNNAGVAFVGMSPAGGNITVINAYNVTPEVYLGTAANASVAGQNPALLGVITGIGSTHFPACLLSN